MVRSGLVGRWAGTNGFRLVAGDPFHESPATASVTTAAGGHLTLVAYGWQHADDGPQDGLVLVGPTGEGDAVTATWGDSWHQQPAPMPLSGSRAGDGSLTLDGSYAGDWGWRIRLGTDEGGELRLRMENVVPAGGATAEMPAGPYLVMDLRAHRS